MWFKGFMHRHPQLSMRTATASNSGRLTALDRVRVAKWSAIVGPLVEQFHPREIFNKDDKGILVESGKMKVGSPAIPHAGGTTAHLSLPGPPTHSHYS